MEDDPWGSTSVDPWMKQPEASESDGPPDPLQVPKEFTMARRSSTTADPWGVTHDDDNDLQTAHPEYAPAAGMPEPQAVPSLAWGAEVVDDGWGPSESKAVQTEQGFKTEVGLDEDTMPNYSNADVNVGFSAAEGREDNAAKASSPLPSPVVSAEIDDETPPIPLEAVSDGLNEKRNGFEEFPSDNDGFAAGPFPSTTVLPTFQTSLPESPSFEDDTFGGFSGGFDEAAPMPEWGPTHKDDDDGWGSPTFDSPVLASQSRAPIDAWGNDETVDPDVTIADIPMDSRNTQEDEWDRARKAVQRREAVAPTELVERLEREWKQLARECYGAKPATASVQAGKDAGLEREDMEGRERLMRELGTLPPELDTYQNNLAMSMTWARYQDALSQVSLDTRSSVLALVSRQSATRAARRSSTEWQQEFRGKNRPDDSLAQKEAQANAQAEEARSKWSFWGRRQSTQTVPLTTSGGGVLEVKALSPSHTGNASVKTNTSVPITAPSPLSTGNAGFALSPIAGSSVPSSIAPLAVQVSTPVDPQQEMPIDPPSGAVGRFFGRFRKPRTSTPSADLSNQDLELTKGDLTFLDQVPTAPMTSSVSPGNVDLLSLGLGQGQNEEMAGLESMLKSKAVALPLRLAPPPISKRSASAASIPKLGPTSRSSSHIDMFGDLDLSSSTSPAPRPKAISATPSNGLFELMTSGSNTPNATQAAGSGAAFDFFETPAAAGPSRLPAVSSPAVATPAPDPSPRPVPASITIADDDGFGDFGSFTDQNGGGMPIESGVKAPSFDDFGDFDSFESPAPVRSQTAAYTQTQSPNRHNGFSNGNFFAGIAPPVATKSTYTEFDPPKPGSNTAAENLVKKASLRQGRWPAPPSPVPDALSPPPGGNFFSSAMGQASAASTMQIDFGSLAPMPPAQRNPSPSPSFPAMTFNGSKAAEPNIKDKRATLSAQDLSFFDTL